MLSLREGQMATRYARDVIERFLTKEKPSPTKIGPVDSEYPETLGNRVFTSG